MLWFLYVNLLALPLYEVTRCRKREGRLLLRLWAAQYRMCGTLWERTPCWYIHIAFVAMFIMMCGYKHSLEPGERTD